MIVDAKKINAAAVAAIEHQQQPPKDSPTGDDDRFDALSKLI